MGLMQVRGLINKSYLDLKMVADYFDRMRFFTEDKESKKVLKMMKSNILEMSYGIQQFITFNDTPELDVWLQYTPELQNISDIISHEIEELNASQLMLIAVSTNKVFEYNFELLSKMKLPDKILDIFNNIRILSNLNSNRKNWHKKIKYDKINN